MRDETARTRERRLPSPCDMRPFAFVCCRTTCNECACSCRSARQRQAAPGAKSAIPGTCSAVPPESRWRVTTPPLLPPVCSDLAAALLQSHTCALSNVVVTVPQRRCEAKRRHTKGSERLAEPKAVHVPLAASPASRAAASSRKLSCWPARLPTLATNSFTATPRTLGSSRVNGSISGHCGLRCGWTQPHGHRQHAVN